MISDDEPDAATPEPPRASQGNLGGGIAASTLSALVASRTSNQDLPNSKFLFLSESQPLLSPSHRRKLLALQSQTAEFARVRGGLEELLYDALLGLLGEGAVSERRFRQWARPEWCVGQCPGCARVLRLLVVPSLDVVHCIHCSTASFACASLRACFPATIQHDATAAAVQQAAPSAALLGPGMSYRGVEGGFADDDECAPGLAPPPLTLRFAGSSGGQWRLKPPPGAPGRPGAPALASRAVKPSRLGGVPWSRLSAAEEGEGARGAGGSSHETHDDARHDSAEPRPPGPGVAAADVAGVVLCPPAGADGALAGGSRASELRASPAGHHIGERGDELQQLLEQLSPGEGESSAPNAAPFAPNAPPGTDGRPVSRAGPTTYGRESMTALHEGRPEAAFEPPSLELHSETVAPMTSSANLAAVLGGAVLGNAVLGGSREMTHALGTARADGPLLMADDYLSGRAATAQKPVASGTDDEVADLLATALAQEVRAAATWRPQPPALPIS